MIRATLKLRYGSRPLRETLAWYIAGCDPTVWLDEVATWNVAHSVIRLLPVPRSRLDRDPSGALVTVSAGRPPSNTSHHCVPFGKIVDRLYLPVEGWLDPDVSDTELGSLLSKSYTYVWHPASGLVALEPDDTLGVSDLLTMRPSLSRRWDRARPGVVISRRLISLVPAETPTIEMILEEGRDDIGTENDALSELPPSPLEPKSDVTSTASRHGQRILASVVRWLTQRVPATSDESTWIDRLEQWAGKRLANLSSDWSARQREIARLLHLLETDPDRGLRFAPSMGGDAHRGRSAPSDRLMEHKIDFDLGHLGGGWAADYWAVSLDFRNQLIARYRQLANREIQLGRHRRAAYIFAELLADFDAAAGALVDGCHWREAAVLYQERLNRPLDAARCLEQGGLWTEAIALYEELEEYEKAGDLHARLEQVESAHQQYRKAVKKHQSNGDLLSSALLLEKKLDSVDEAIDVLSSGWPDSSQAVQCLCGVFQIFGRLGRHASAQLWIKAFREGPLPDRNRIELVNLLADTAAKFPDRMVQAAAADCTRVLVSRQLSAASQSDCGQLLSAVRRLVPEDRLLSRDCQRYLQQRPVAPQARTPIPGTRKKRPRLVHTIQLPGNVSWQQATSRGKTIFCAGKIEDELVLVRSSWEAADRPIKRWRIEPHLSESPILLVANPYSDGFALLHVVGGPILTDQPVFPPSDNCPIPTSAGAARGMSASVVAAARPGHGITWLLESREAHLLTLIAAGPHGEQVSTETVHTPDSFWKNDNTPHVIPVPLHARGNRVYIGVDNNVLIFARNKPQPASAFGLVRPPESIAFGERIVSLVGSPPTTSARVAATFARGAMYCGRFEGGSPALFASDMSCPLVCINRGGYLIAASEDGCEVYSTDRRRVRFEAELLTDIRAKPVAVLSAPRPDQFGIMSDTGEIAVYELAR